jgi:hypothetical protein
MVFALWGFYILGGVLSVWKRANLSANQKFTPWQNVRQYAVAHGPQIGINFLLSSGLFWVMWHDTSFLAKILQYFGINKDFDVPLNPFTAAVYGVFSDQIMDFIVAKISVKVPAIQANTGANNVPTQNPQQP